MQWDAPMIIDRVSSWHHPIQVLAYQVWLLNPAWPGGSTRWLDRSGFNKSPVGTITWKNLIDPTGQPMNRANPDETHFFLKCEIWNPLVYILYIPKKKKSYVFSMWDKKTFWFKYFNLKGQHNIFSTWDLKPFRIYTLYSNEKNYVFSMWNLKLISIYTLCFQEKNNHDFSIWDEKKTFWFKYFNLKG